jgi:hypothetical protein
MNALEKIQELKSIITSINETLKMEMNSWERKEWVETLEYTTDELLVLQNHVSSNIDLF